MCQVLFHVLGKGQQIRKIPFLVEFYNLASRVGNGNPLQYSCLENSMDRGAWQATVHEVAESWT